MALIVVNDTDTFQQWKDKSNLLGSQVGDLNTLNTTNKTSIINAINEVKGGNVGSIVASGTDWSISLNGTRRAFITSAGAIDLTGAVTVSQNLSTSGNIVSGGTLSVTGVSNLNGNVALGGTLNVGAATTLTGSLTVGGNSTMNGTLVVSNGITGIITDCSRTILPAAVKPYLIGGGTLNTNLTFAVDATETTATANKVVARDSAGGITCTNINSDGSVFLSGVSAFIRQQDRAVDSGAAADGYGKLEYVDAKWNIKASSNSTRIVNFQRGTEVLSYIGTDGVFNGTATAARFADLAEKYTTDKEYPVGTVMVVAVGGDSECTQSFAPSQLCIGVISDKPAYLMNAEANGQAIALKGRVPVRVIGPVHKGQTLVSTADGRAMFGLLNPIGCALETNADPGEKLVEVAII